MKIIPFNHKKTIKTCGLMNFGSICYLNSFIQSLLSCTCITEFFLSNEIKFVSDNNRVAVEYIKLLKDIMNTTNYNTVLNPGGLFNSLTTIINRKYTKKIFGRGQEDSGEAIHYFLDSIDDENLYKMFKCRYIVKIWCTKCCKEISSSIDESCMIEIPQNFNKMTFNNSTSINEFIRQHVSILSDYK